ncbi:hypothetical protein A2U01_0046218, partial [Trifolium medium]|nr:hypothetical protein [Trifolium medium]
MEFKIGDMVLVKLQPYRQHSVALHHNQKLSFCYFGPFPVIDKIGYVAYKLLLPPSARIHPVFHISVLKSCNGEHDRQYCPLPLLTSEEGPQVLPKAILKTRTLLRNHVQVPQVLVQWDLDTLEDASWMDWAPLHRQYPSLNLEDKVNFNGGCIVMNDKGELTEEVTAE